VKRILAGSGAVLCLAACGGGNGAARPSAVAETHAALADSLVAGTVLQVTSGETGEAIDGAVVTVHGRDYTSAGGRITLAEAAPLQSEIGIVASGMLDRRTLLRDVSTTRFALWPQRSPTGMDESFTQAIVYSHPNGTGPLRRLVRGTTRVVVVPSEEIRGEQEMIAHQEAADRITTATAGQVAYVVATQRPATGAYVETRLGNEDDALCGQNNILGFEQDFLRGGETVHALIVFCDPKSARTAVVSHEMGHTFGLYHSPDKGEVMYAFFNGHGAVEFSPREGLEMRLMLQRPGGNVFPDDDRAVSLSAATGIHTTICRTLLP